MNRFKYINIYIYVLTGADRRTLYFLVLFPEPADNSFQLFGALSGQVIASSNKVTHGAPNNLKQVLLYKLGLEVVFVFIHGALAEHTKMCLSSGFGIIVIGRAEALVA